MTSTFNPYASVPGPDPVFTFSDGDDADPGLGGLDDSDTGAPCPVINPAPGALSGTVSSSVSTEHDTAGQGIFDPPEYVPTEVSEEAQNGETVPDAETLIGRILTGPDPESVTQVVDTALARAEAMMRPVDTMQLCRDLQRMAGRWYDCLRDRILSRDDRPGTYYGYRVDRTAKSRSVDFDVLKKHFPEAYAAAVTEPGPEDFVTKLTLDRRP